MSVLIHYEQGGIHLKKIIAVMCAFMIVVLLGITGEAAQSTPESSSMPPKLTQEQKAEMSKQFEEEFKAAQEKFNALTDKQKKEIYDLYDKVNVAKVKLLDKYVEFGLLSKEDAEAMQKHMASFSEKVREDQQFIGFKGMGHHKTPITEQSDSTKTE